MGKLVEDSRVLTFAQDSLVPHDTYLNEIQDQLRGTHKARRLDVMGLFNCEGTPDTPSTWGLVENGGITASYYWEGDSNSNDLVAFLPLRVGEKITAIDCVLYGSNTGGNIDLYKTQWLTGTGNASLNTPIKVVSDIGGTDPWNRGGNYDRVTVSGLSVVIDADYQYYFVAVSDDLGVDRIAHFSITVQFGN